MCEEMKQNAKSSITNEPTGLDDVLVLMMKQVIHESFPRDIRSQKNAVFVKQGEKTSKCSCPVMLAGKDRTGNKNKRRIRMLMHRALVHRQ